MASGLGRGVNMVSPGIRRQSLWIGLLALMLFIAGVYQQAAIAFDLLATVLLAMCVGVLLWLAETSGGPAFMQDVVRMQFLGRMDGSEGVSGSLYYFTRSLGNYALAYPLHVNPL